MSSNSFDDALGTGRGTGKKLPIYKYLDLCTEHVAKDEYDALRSNRLDHLVAVMKDSDGTWVSVPEDWEAREEVSDSCPTLAVVLHFAHAHDCLWVHLDGDAELIDDLPVHAWERGRR